MLRVYAHLLLWLRAPEYEGTVSETETDGMSSALDMVSDDTLHIGKVIAVTVCDVMWCGMQSKLIKLFVTVT